MNLPLLALLALPFLAAPLAYPLRRTPLAAPLAAITAGLMLVLLWGVPWPRVAAGPDQITLGAPVVVLGRTIRLTEADRWALTALWGVAALAFLTAWPFPFERRLYPIGLTAAGLWTAGLLIRPVGLGAFAIGSAALLLALTVLGEGHGMAGAMSYLIAASLGVLLWTTAAWAAEQAGLNPGQPLWTLLTPTMILLALALWLGVWPAHRWVPLLLGEGAPVGGAFTLFLLHAGTWLWLPAWIQSFPWLALSPLWTVGLQAIGAVMVLSSAALALPETGWGRLGGYGWLASSGLSWLALGLGTAEGIHLSAWSMGIRVIPLLGMAFALAAYRRMARSTAFGQVPLAQGPWVIALLLGSGLALVDAPPFPGFAGRWALLRWLLPGRPGLALALIAVTGAMGWTFLRGLVAASAAERPLHPMPRSARWFGLAWWTAQGVLWLATPWLGSWLEPLTAGWTRALLG